MIGYLAIGTLAIGAGLLLTRPSLRSRLSRRHSAPAAPSERVPASWIEAPAPVSPSPLRRTCPLCRRSYDGFRFCPVDAQSLDLPPEASDLTAVGVARLTCSVCHRLFLADSGSRYCPFDGRPLTGVEMPVTASAIASTGGGKPRPGLAKFCPTCSQRVDTGATQCERDGSELVSLN